MNEKRGYHVTVVDNKTGETVSDFNTRAIVYVMLKEIDKEKGKKELPCSFGTCQCVGRIGLHEMLGITNGLQELLQDITREHPELELIARLFNQRTVDLDHKEG